MVSRIDMSEFSRAAVADLAEDVQGDLETYVKRGSLQALSSIVEASPVNEGRFRSGWITTANATSNYAPPPGQESYPNDAVSKGSSVIKSLKGFPVVYIQNNVEYGPFLADGSSAQAPAGFVELAVEAAFA
ncbi:hypothetical protein [Roseibium aggregatum]|uniref:HK97 gp10 family phage protein n=1 Tax=Roseibium aggregatum TaxID=187304 RepID=A0A0M6Y7W6_9HYPH|nr:hypothetical protein [Roseibium aggregatum]CTQ45768.1 hypothetical protein LAL4801_04223 [Roseibium aggregatum]